MKRHSIDISAFVFGIAFLLAAAFAMAVQAGTFAFGDSRGDSWVAPAVLLTTGAVAVVGTLIAATNRSGSTEQGPTARSTAGTTALPIVAPDVPTVAPDATSEMPNEVESTVRDDDLTAEQPLTGTDQIDRRDDADEPGTPPLS